MLLVAIAGCDTDANPLAPYEGSRPLIVQAITTSYSPDIAWVGGRVAAVGINRGEQAALDSSLVWLHTADGNTLESPVYMRDVMDAEGVASFGGTPSDSLADRETYTLWLAEQAAFDAALNGADLDTFTFADTTFSMAYLLRGRSAGGVDVDFTVYRDQRILSDEFHVRWTPADQAFRRVAITNLPTGAFTDLLWHVVLPDTLDDNITSPLVIGQIPQDAIEAVEWDGFGTGQHVLWAATDEWEGDSFGFTTRGYAFIQLFADNF